MDVNKQNKGQASPVILSELISKFNVGLRALLRDGLSEPEFYGDLVYKCNKNRKE